MKRTLIAIIIAVVLLFAGCQNTVPTVTTGGANAVLLPAEYDAQNKYLITGAANFQETDGFFCGTNLLGNYIQYYDKSNGLSGVLCADPACAHDSKECGAYIQQGANFSYYNGSIYWIDEDAASRDKCLWKSDLSGKNREKIMQISFDDVLYPYQPQSYVIHQGNLFILGHASVVDGTQSGYRVSLLSRHLSGDEDFTVVYDEVFTGSSKESYRFVGGAVYLSLVTYEDTTAFDLTVMKFDIKNNKSEIMYHETDMPVLPEGFWVTEDHEIYLFGSADKMAYLWRLEGDTKVEIASWPANSVVYPSVMDGIAVLLTRDENKIRQIDIRDFSGETIYAGKLFPDPVSGLEKDPNTYDIMVVGGDTEKIVVNLSEFTNKGIVDYTVMLDLKDNMKATILWSSEE